MKSHNKLLLALVAGLVLGVYQLDLPPDALAAQSARMEKVRANVQAAARALEGDMLALISSP